MFQFNFIKNDENTEEEAVLKTDEPKQPLKQSKRIEIKQDQYEEIAKSLLDRSFQMFTTKELEVGYVNNSNINETDNSDLISGVYEGGYKIWECTQDLADYFSDDSTKLRFNEKNVCDLGCSAGILGLVALINDAKSVHFQDYVSQFNLSLYKKYI